MARINFVPFPTLRTDRLILRQLKATDDEYIFAHRCDDKVNTYLEGWRHSSIEQTRAFIERVQNEIVAGKTIMWVLTEKGKDKFIGTICFWNILEAECKAEIGYTLASEFHGIGYMNEALVKVIDFGFNLMKIKTIEAYTHEDNKNSIQLLLRNKFVKGSSPKPVSINRVFFSLANE